MSSPGSSSGRRRTTSRQYSAEDQALNQIAREAESRLAARRAQRAEARDVRIREIERQQKEQEEKEKNDAAGSTVSSSRYTPSSVSSRRGSNDSSSTAGEESSQRELRKELLDLEEKYHKSMLNNAQLDSEKQTFRYQVDLYKDQLEDLKEQLVEITRLHKDKSRELEHKKRDFTSLQGEKDFLAEQIKLRDELIDQYGLVFISNDNLDDTDDNNKKKASEGQPNGTCGLVTPDAAVILQKHEGNLDERLKKFAEDQSRLEEENKKLKQQLDEEREKSSLAEKYAASPKITHKVNGPDVETLEMQMEAQKQLNDYKFRLKKAEQEKTTYEGNVIRLESQVKRYRTAAENSEKVEDELKQEKRKLQRELREAQAQMEELTSQNHHLQKRIEKIRSARNAFK